MPTKRKLLAMGGALAGAMMTALFAPAPAALAQDKTYVMKLATATINDTQHEWLKRFGAAVEKDSGGRIKAEIYPASQLGPIPRQIEGVQFGSIQAWIGPPEFLVGVDVRYEVLSAPGLMTSFDQMQKVVYDPAVQKMMFDLGANKGLEGIGFSPYGPSSIITKKEVKTISGRVDGYEVSQDGKKALVRDGKTFSVIDVSADSVKTEDRVDLSGIQLEIQPRAEWRQMFDESWRVARDFFYDPNMHGVDWDAVKTKYAARVEGIGDRSELNEILGDMIAELQVGHAFIGGGDTPDGGKAVPLGYLGADYAPVPGKNAVKIVRLLPGDGFDLDARSPLLAPGLNVHEGDYILAVSGQPVREDQDIRALLVGTARAVDDIDQVLQKLVNKSFRGRGVIGACGGGAQGDTPHQQGREQAAACWH